MDKNEKVKKAIWGTLIILLFCMESQAGEFYLAGSTNTSRFYNNQSGLLGGFSAGCGREWQLNESLTMALGISCLCRGTRLENILIYNSNNLTTCDFILRIGYLDVPVTLRWHVKGIASQSCFMSFGLAPAFAVYDGSSFNIIWRRSTPYGYPTEHKYISNLDYTKLEIPGNSSLDALAGFGKRWERFAAETQFRWNFYGEVDSLHGVSGINSKFLTAQLLILWYF